ncbi:MAG: TolB family protein [Planctomycetota bacterium]|jgi:Tol biopolymer transport system component
MRPIVAVLLGTVLLPGCIPVEVKRNRAGAFAYRIENGVAVLAPGGKGARKFTALLGKDEKCQPIWLEWSPDGRQLALACDRGGDRAALCTLDPATGAVRTLASHPHGIWFPRHAGDGQTLGFVVAEDVDEGLRAELRVVALRTGAERVLVKRCGLLHAWSPDGKSVAVVQSSASSSVVDDDELTVGSLVLVDVATGTTERLASVFFSHFTHLRFSPDGQRIYFCAPRVTLPAAPVDMDKVPFGLFVFDRGKKPTTLLSRPGERVLYSAPSPSGKRMLYVAAREDKALEGAVILFDEESNDRTTIAENRGNLFPFWADEDRIAFAAGGKPKRILARDRSGENEEDLTARFEGIDID